MGRHPGTSRVVGGAPPKGGDPSSSPCHVLWLHAAILFFYQHTGFGPCRGGRNPPRIFHLRIAKDGGKVVFDFPFLRWIPGAGKRVKAVSIP